MFLLGNRQNRTVSTVESTPVQASPDDADVSLSTAPSLPYLPNSTALGAEPQWDLFAPSVVRIDASIDPDCPWSGSGSVIEDGSLILTNAHVAIRDDGSTPCRVIVGVIKDASETPSDFYSAWAIAWDNELDIAVLKVIGNDGTQTPIEGVQPLVFSNRSPRLGEHITTLSFPGQGGDTITLSSGEYSGLSTDSPPFYKTTAALNAGGSGGAAFLMDGSLVGVITAVVIPTGDEINSSLGLIRPVSQILSLLEIARDSEIAPESSIGNLVDGNVETVEPSMDPRFGTCKEAKANGYGPYYDGIDEEYDWYRDRDGDGVVCE